MNDNKLKISEEEKGKEEPLVKENDTLEDSQSKKRLLLLYGGTVGGMLFVVIIVFIISLKVGGSSSNGEEGGKIFAVYETKEGNATVKLISSKYKDYIGSIKVNGKDKNFNETYLFEKVGEYKVEIVFKKKLDILEEMFKYCSYLKEVNLTNLETKNVTNMTGMFYQSKNLEKVDFGKKTEKITKMDYLFYGCFYLTQENILNLNTHNVIDMSYMFAKCTKISYFNLEKINTQKVEKMKGFLKND